MNSLSVLTLAISALAFSAAPQASEEFPNAWLTCTVGSQTGAYTKNSCYLRTSSGPNSMVAYFQPSAMINSWLMDGSGPTYHFTGCTEITGPQTGWIPTCAATIPNHQIRTATIYVDGWPGMTSSATASYDAGIIP